MSDNVVDFAAAKRRRQSRVFFDSIREGRWTDEELDEAYDASLIIDRGLRPVGPPVIDEVSHWTVGWEQLLESILRPDQTNEARRKWLNDLAWSESTPERRAEVDRVLRILRGTDHGSDDGNTEGHRADPGLPRG